MFASQLFLGFASGQISRDENVVLTTLLKAQVVFAAMTDQVPLVTSVNLKSGAGTSLSLSCNELFRITLSTIPDTTHAQIVGFLAGSAGLEIM